MGILRPKIQILDEQHKKDILEEAKQILLKLGIFIENNGAEELLKDQGVENKEKRYFIPPDLVDRCLKSVPSEISLYDREGNHSLTLKNDNIHYDPGSAAIFI